MTEKLVSGKTALVSIFDIHSLRTFFIESDDFHDYFTEGQSFFCQAEVRWRIQLVLKRLEERGNKEGANSRLKASLNLHCNRDTVVVARQAFSCGWVSHDETKSCLSLVCSLLNAFCRRPRGLCIGEMKFYYDGDHFLHLRSRR